MMKYAVVASVFALRLSMPKLAPGSDRSTERRVKVLAG
jgi:hypothetical protein